MKFVQTSIVYLNFNIIIYELKYMDNKLEIKFIFRFF